LIFNGKTVDTGENLNFLYPQKYWNILEKELIIKSEIIEEFHIDF